jgi:hypothetical protein
MYASFVVLQKIWWVSDHTPGQGNLRGQNNFTAQIGLITVACRAFKLKLPSLIFNLDIIIDYRILFAFYLSS